MSSLCLLRCNGFTPVERALVTQLRGWFEERVVLAADERQWEVKAQGVDKLSLTDGLMASLGLHPHHAWPWRCGDYALIAARAAYPRISHFWVVEPDVYFATNTIEGLFAQMEMSDVDLISPLIERCDEHWMWTPRMARHHSPVYRCHFPLIRASARLIDEVAEVRRLMTIDPGPDPAENWPNDEAVVGTVAHARGLRTATVAELCEDEGITAPFGHRDTRIWRLSHLRSAHPDGRIYHPAYPERRFADYLEAVATHEPERLSGLLERLGDSVTPEEVFALGARADATAEEVRATA